MGSRMKKSIFDEQTSKALKSWHNAVKRKQGQGDKWTHRTLVSSTADTSVMSTGPSTDEDREIRDHEIVPFSEERNVIVTVDQGNQQSPDSFSFGKPAPRVGP